MKKILLFALAMLALPLPALSETGAQTIQFLEQLNLKYYCLLREGLKGFTCNAKWVLDPQAEEYFKSLGATEELIAQCGEEGFNVSVSAAGRVNAEPAFGFSAADEAARKNAEYFRSVVLNLLKAWADAVVQPLHDPKDFTAYQVNKGFLGFKVVKTGNNVRTVEKYDWRSKLTNVSEAPETGLVTHWNAYSKTAQGYLLEGIESVKGVEKHTVKYGYQTVGNFRLLESLESTGSDPAQGKTVRVVLRFSRYRLAQ